MTVTLNVTHELEVIDSGCGHTVYLEAQHYRRLLRNHKNFYCTVCGEGRHWKQKSDLEELRGRLASTQDMLDTARQQRDHVEHRRRGEKAAKTRIKNRIANGVCPCCQRSFKNLHRHMQTKHPDYSTSD